MTSRFVASVQQRVEVLAVALNAKALALAEGLRLKHAEELALVVAELGMNALNHGKSTGAIEVSVDGRGWSVGVEDSGPGLSPAVIADGGRTDHFGANGLRPLGDQGSFGSGLAAVRRLSTRLELANKTTGGARALAQRTFTTSSAPHRGMNP